MEDHDNDQYTDENYDDENYDDDNYDDPPYDSKNEEDLDTHISSSNEGMYDSTNSNNNVANSDTLTAAESLVSQLARSARHRGGAHVDDVVEDSYSGVDSNGTYSDAMDDEVADDSAVQVVANSSSDEAMYIAGPQSLSDAVQSDYSDDVATQQDLDSDYDSNHAPDDESRYSATMDDDVNTVNEVS